MADPILLFGNAVIVPTGGLALAWSAVARASDATTQALSGTATLTAGTYSPDGFINHAASKMRTSIYNAIAAAAFFTTEPANAAAVPFKIGMPSAGPSFGVGATLLRVVMATTGGALKGGLATTWQSFSLVNTTSTWCWLGLAYPAETRALSIVADGPDDTGRFQPRWLHFFRATFADSGDYPIFPGHFSEQYDDGTVAQYSFGGGPRYHRDMTLKTMAQHIAGPPWLIGRFSSFNSSVRNRLTYIAMDETLFTGISGTDKRSDYLTSPVYLQCGRWWARYRETTGGYFHMMDLWPTSITPTAGNPVQAYSEAMAMVEEWRRTGLLFRFETLDQTAGIQWVSKAYAPNRRGSWEIRPVRRGNSLFYDLDLSMLLVQHPELATP